MGMNIHFLITLASQKFCTGTYFHIEFYQICSYGSFKFLFKTNDILGSGIEWVFDIDIIMFAYLCAAL